MTNRLLRSLSLAVCLLPIGCGDKASPTPSGGDKPTAVTGSETPKTSGPTLTQKKPEHDDDHHHHGKGPNGGVIFDLGRHHAEFTVDHDKKECKILFLKGDDEKAQPLPVGASELTLTTKPTKTKDGKEVPALTIKLMAKDTKDGKATTFVGTDPGLGNVAEFAGTVVGEIGGNPAQGEFKE